jgi:hypothetical protein
MDITPGTHSETCACGCGRPFSDGQEIVLVDHDGTQHWHCRGCGQSFRQGQDIQTVYDFAGELKLPMHLKNAVHAHMAHGPGSN